MNKNNLIPIHETFQQTLQGEGKFAGTVVDFIRLQGCPVGCPFCDTGYADGGHNTPRTKRDIDSLVAEVKSPRVVISGGEPLIQPLLPDLVYALQRQLKLVHVETSGAFWQPLQGCWITLSPKQHISPKYPVDERFWSRANEIKLVISDGSEIDFYRTHLDFAQCPIYLQPEWTDRDRTIPLVVNLLQQHPSYRLSLQLHKLLGIQ